MHDEIDGRLWIEHGSKLTRMLGKLWDVISVSLARVHREHFDAPWHDDARRIGESPCRR